MLTTGPSSVKVTIINSSDDDDVKHCIACGGKLRRLSKTKDWEDRQFHINCFNSIVSTHMDCASHFKNMSKKYEKLKALKDKNNSDDISNGKPVHKKNRYLKRKGIGLNFIEFPAPVTLYFD